MPRKKQGGKRVQFSDQQERENDHKSKNYCLCQKAASGFMLQCDRCKEWYHGACVKIEDKDIGNNTEFVCVMCSDTKCSELVNYPRKYVITRRSVGSTYDRGALQLSAFHQLSFCTCNSRDDGRPMVRCSICKEWYHTQCASIRGVDWDNLERVDSQKTAFACLRCTDERMHLLVDEDLMRHGAVCENNNYTSLSTSSHPSKNTFLHSLVSTQMRHSPSSSSFLSSTSSSLSNLQWNNFKTLVTYDLCSWMDIAPWALKRVPFSSLSSSLSLLSVGTNRGTVEVFEMATDPSSEPLVLNLKKGQEKDWIAKRVQSLHQGTLNSTLDALEWTGDGSCVSVGTWSEGRIEVIDAQANIPVRALVGHNGLVRSLHIPSSSSSSSSSSPLSPSSSSSFSHSENTLVSASHDKRVILWDLRSNEGHSGKVVGARTLPSYSSHCIISAGDSSIRVWDVRREDSCLHTISVPGDRSISSLDLSSAHLAVNTSPGNLFLFSNLDLLSPSTFPHCSTLKGYSNKFWSMGKVYFSPDEKYLATGSEDGYLLVWEVKTGTLVYKSRTHSHWVWDLVWLPDSGSYSSPSIATCSEDLTLAISGVGPGPAYNRTHEWGPVGYKNLRVPYGTKVFARWPNGRYYHGAVDYEVAGVGGVGTMSSVKFRGWHGPDSRATYESISLFPDSSNCTCKKGHSAKDIPFVLNIPLSPPPSPSVTPSPTISPSSSPRSSSDTVMVAPAPEKRKRKTPIPPTSESPSLPLPPRTSSFGRTIKKSRFLDDSPPPSPKHSRKNKLPVVDLSSIESIEVSPTKVTKKKSPRKTLLFSHSELIPLPSEFTDTPEESSNLPINLSTTPPVSPPIDMPSNTTTNTTTTSPSVISSPIPISPSPSIPSSPLRKLPEFSSFSSIPWHTPATSSPIVPKYSHSSPSPSPSPTTLPLKYYAYPLSPSPYPPSPLPSRTNHSSSNSQLPPLSSLFNNISRSTAQPSLNFSNNNSVSNKPTEGNTTKSDDARSPVWLSPPKM